MFPLVCADCPLYYDLCMQLYTRQLADFLAQPPVSRQPSPRQGRLESSSVELSAGEELDTLSQGQEVGGTSAGVRWVTRDQPSDAGGDSGDIAGIPHSATGE